MNRVCRRAQGDIREHAVMVMPLVVLAVPSLLLGGLWLKAAMSQPAALVSSLTPQPAYQVLRELALSFPGVGSDSPRVRDVAIFGFRWRALQQLG